jgi:polygalacturonase
LVKAFGSALSVLVSLLGFTGCSGDTSPIQEWTYVCGEYDPAVEGWSGDGQPCGAGDPKLPPEPTYPTDVCQELKANKTFPDENDVCDGVPCDTKRIQEALIACKGRAVKLVADGANNAFLTSRLVIDSETLWIDGGVTLYASRNPELYQKDGNCGVLGISDSGGCNPILTVIGIDPAIMGEGVIDGQGGEPVLGKDYSWWEMSAALRSIDGSGPAPATIEVQNAKHFVMYKITLHNSPKFHVKLASTPTDGVCDAPGEGFTVWGVTLLTPSRLFDSRGLRLDPHSARNTDGIDPGSGGIATCGVLACSMLSTGDDQVAIKGGKTVDGLIIAHNHFGTGHGMSIGSETYGGVHNVEVYDLTIDGDSRWSGSHNANSPDDNGIRVKSDESRGGLVENVSYTDVCIRDVANYVIVSTSYNPLFSGESYPVFQNISFTNVRGVTCASQMPPIVTLNGFSAALPAGPINLDNVVMDNIGPPSVGSRFAQINIGPRDVNFRPTGMNVVVSDNATEPSAPRECRFAKLPAPELPPGWLF